MWGGCCSWTALNSFVYSSPHLLIGASGCPFCDMHFQNLKSFPIYTDTADDAAFHKRLEMATPHLSINRLNAENNHTFEFTPLCV